MPVTISLPLPDRCLSPNARTHWATKARATKRLRSLARDAASLAIGATGDALPFATARVRVVYRVRDRRRRDRDNMLAALKAAFDGIADAGVVVDDAALVYLPVEVEVVGRGGETGVDLHVEG